MIGFFRKIRKKLADQNKFLQYSRYAIGEIVLVMVGILLALQVNNWNNERRDRLLEAKILEEIKSNLEIDLEEISSDINVIESINEMCREMFITLKNQSTPSDDFSYNTQFLKVVPHFDPNRSGYGLLMSSGVRLIQNDSLRGSISRLYELRYPYFNKYENERIQFRNLHINPFLLKNFDWLTVENDYGESSFYISDIDYRILRTDGSFRKLLNAFLYENVTLLDRANWIKQDIIDLAAMIDDEMLVIKVKQ